MSAPNNVRGKLHEVDVRYKHARRRRGDTASFISRKRKLFCRRSRWQRHTRPAVRSARLGGLRRRDSGVARDRNAARIPPKNAGRFLRTSRLG